MNQSEIVAVGKLKLQGLQYVDIARQTGLSIDAVKRRWYAFQKLPQPVDPAGPSTVETDLDIGSYKLGGDAKDRKILMQADEINRLRKEIKYQHRTEMNTEMVKDILGTLAQQPADIPDWVLNPPKSKKGAPTMEVPITSWADWHAGEVVQRSELNGINEYNTDIMDERIQRLVSNTIDIGANHASGNYPGIVVNLIGDMVSGGLHEEHRKTDDMSPGQAALYVSDRLVWGLQKMADQFGRVYCPAVCGNHGRTTAKPEFKRYIYNNWDYVIYQIVKRRLADMKDDRIVIDCRDSNEVYYRVWDARYLACHGDMLGTKGGDGIIGAIGPIMRGEIKTRGRTASSGMPYDILVIGHWHQQLWLPRCIVANTLKGYCEYAKNALGAIPTAPSQPLWFNHPNHGITSRWEIMVDEPIAKHVEPVWTTMFDPAGQAA